VLKIHASRNYQSSLWIGHGSKRNHPTISKEYDASKLPLSIFAILVYQTKLGQLHIEVVGAAL
jgi:hypothetical protein